jgi:hypothetical protein
MRKLAILLVLLAVGWVISDYKGGSLSYAAPRLMAHDELQTLLVGETPPCIGPCKGNKYPIGCRESAGLCPTGVSESTCAMSTWHESCPGEMDVSVTDLPGQPNSWANPVHNDVCDNVQKGDCLPVTINTKTYCEPHRPQPAPDPAYVCGGGGTDEECLYPIN